MAHRHDIKNIELHGKKKMSIQFFFNPSNYGKKNDRFGIIIELVFPEGKQVVFTRKLIL